MKRNKLNQADHSSYYILLISKSKTLKAKSKSVHTRIDLWDEYIIQVRKHFKAEQLSIVEVLNFNSVVTIIPLSTI